MSLARILAAIAATVLLAAPSLASGQGLSGLRQFLSVYRCPLVERLERIYDSGDPSSHRDRFFAATARRATTRCIPVS